MDPSVITLVAGILLVVTLLQIMMSVGGFLKGGSGGVRGTVGEIIMFAIVGGFFGAAAVWAAFSDLPTRNAMMLLGTAFALKWAVNIGVSIALMKRRARDKAAR